MYIVYVNTINGYKKKSSGLSDPVSSMDYVRMIISGLLIVTGISQTSRMNGIYCTKWLRETRDTMMYVGYGNK